MATNATLANPRRSWRASPRPIASSPRSFPGYGESTGIDEIHEVLDFTLTSAQLVEEIAGGPVDVVGHSLGGMLAAEFAAICPHLVRKLVLVDAFGLWLEENQLPDLFVLNEKQLKAAKWANPDARIRGRNVVVAGPRR